MFIIDHRVSTFISSVVAPGLLMGVWEEPFPGRLVPRNKVFFWSPVWDRDFLSDVESERSEEFGE